MTSEELVSSNVCYGCDSETSESIYCEGCDNRFCRNCYLLRHWCDELTDITGRLVKVGDKLFYVSRPKFTYEVLDIPRLYKIGGICLGKEVSKADKPVIPLRPRLMEIK